MERERERERERVKRERERERGVRDGREKKGEWGGVGGGGWGGWGDEKKEAQEQGKGRGEQKDWGRWRGKVLEKQTLYSYIKVREKKSHDINVSHCFRFYAVVHRFALVFVVIY